MRLPFRYLLLIAATAMTGVTAYGVSSGPPPNLTRHVSPEIASGGGVGSDRAPVPPHAIPDTRTEPNLNLADGFERIEVTRVVVPDDKEATLVFGGDILIHASIRRVASTGADTFDFRPLFDGIRPLVAGADLAICHLEVPLTSTNTDLSTYPRFNAPFEVADGIAHAGFDGCSTASNHAMDQGPEGLIATLDLLDAAGVKHAGTARSAAEASTATVYQVGELTVAHIAATYWLNGLTTPQGQEWMAQRIDVDSMLEMAGRARWAGADLVVVSIHCCTEYRAEPTAEQVAIFEQLIRSPWVDLVVGHHSHIVGPVTKIGGEYVAYGLGNLVSGQRQFTGTMEGVLVVATAEWVEGSWVFAALSVVPTIVNPSNLMIELAPEDSSSFARTMSAVNLYGPGIGVYRPDGSVAAK